jgi:hypothetical protein
MSIYYSLRLQLSSLYLAKVMAIPDFFKEFLRIFIQKISKIPNFEYEVIWKTSMRSKWRQESLSSLQLAKVMAIPKLEIWVLQNFWSNFKVLTCNFLTITKKKFQILSMRSYGELQYAQNDTNCSSLACI